MTPYDADGIQRRIFSKRLLNGSVDDMAVDGSVTNQTFEIAPPVDQIWRISQWAIFIQDEKGFDITSYGNGSALTNGMLIQGTFGGVTSDLLPFPIKSTADIISVTYEMDLKTFGNNDDVLVARWRFTDCGQFVRLDGSQGDKLQVVIRDDMTFLDKQIITAQGYIE